MAACRATETPTSGGSSESETDGPDGQAEPLAVRVHGQNGHPGREASHEGAELVAERAQLRRSTSSASSISVSRALGSSSGKSSLSWAAISRRPLDHALAPFLERPHLLAEPLLAAARVALDLERHLLRGLTGRAGLLLGVREDPAGLFLRLPALLGAVAVDGLADVAGVILGVLARALGLAGELVDAGGRVAPGALDDFPGLRLRLGADLLRSLLGCAEHAGDGITDVCVFPCRSRRLLERGDFLFELAMGVV